MLEKRRDKYAKRSPEQILRDKQRMRNRKNISNTDQPGIGSHQEEAATANHHKNDTIKIAQRALKKINADQPDTGSHQEKAATANHHKNDMDNIDPRFRPR